TAAAAGLRAAAADSRETRVDRRPRARRPERELAECADASCMHVRALETLLQGRPCRELLLEASKLATRVLVGLDARGRLRPRERLEDVRDETGPQVRVGVLPGVELDVPDVPAIGRGRLRAPRADREPLDSILDLSDQEGLARSPVAEEADRNRRLGR